MYDYRFVASIFEYCRPVSKTAMSTKVSKMNHRSIIHHWRRLQIAFAFEFEFAFAFIIFEFV